MNRFGRMIRAVLVWWLPTMLLFLAMLAGAVAWVVGTQAGAQWTLRTAATQFGGQAENVQGSIWGGLRVGRLALGISGVVVDARDVVLQVAWPELLQRRLHITELATADLRLALAPAPATPQDAQPAVTGDDFALPVDIAVDRLAIGAFALRQNDQALPVGLEGLRAALDADAGGARLRIDALHLTHPMGQADVQGQASLARLADPWPVKARLRAVFKGQAPDSPLCVGRFVSDMAAPAGRRTSAATAPPAAPAVQAGQHTAGEEDCRVDADLRVGGSLHAMDVSLAAEGADAALALQAALAPRDVLPVHQASLALTLPGRTAAAVAVQASRDSVGTTHMHGTLSADHLDLGRLAGDAIPDALLTSHGSFDAELTADYVLRQGFVDLVIDKGSRWNRQPLEGKAQARVATAAARDASVDWPAALAGIRAPALDVDLRLGRNRLRAQGSFGPDNGAIKLDASAPQLAAFWPGLEGAADLQARLSGTPARHRITLKGGYTPAQPRPGMLGRARLDAEATIEGGWRPGQGPDAAAREPGWRGSVSRLSVSHAGFSVAVPRPVTLTYLPHATAPLWQWQLGAARVELGLPGGERIVFDHGGSRGAPGRWESAGRIDNLVLTPATVRRVRRAVDPDTVSAEAGRPRNARVNASIAPNQRRIALDASWELRFNGALAGRLRVERRSGDLLIPGDPATPLGVRTLVLDARATAVSARASRIQAELQMTTAAMGALHGTATAMLATDAAGGLSLAPREPVRVSLDANISNLKWVEIFTGDTTEVGGALQAKVQAEGLPGGAWKANGTIRGQHLRYVRIDDGVRLLDGTLSARLQDDRLLLDSLRFPAALRVVPNEARTRTWLTKDPDARNGYLEASGAWSLMDAGGQVKVVLHRFPVVQRADRFAMMSGRIDIEAALPRITIRGDVKADAGWASLEVLSEVPSLDDDVVVRRTGMEQVQRSAPMHTDMDLKVDLGPRFYVTGMGLDAALVGSIRIRYVGGRLSGTGAVHTRAGRIDAYGQRLQLRRGTVTFQGALDNPLLDIEALRTGEQVEAGVRVSGTAQRPRIDLISYPDVSDVEKLSWLVLGRPADSSGNDTALLVSVGTALLGNGTPFYKKFGVDDISMRNGTIGSSGSLLPQQTVASNVNQDYGSALATQFLVASKIFANGVTLSVEQAMAGSETVGRLSYKLSRRWSVDLKGGSVNGLELVYRTFFGR